MTRSTILFAFAATAIAAASPAFADEGKAPPATVAAAAPATEAAPADTQRYCVVSQVTGSHIDRRECHTRTDWLKQGFDPLAPRR